MLDFPGLRELFASGSASMRVDRDYRVEKDMKLVVFNYREFENNKGREVMFDVAGKREILYKLNKWVEEVEKMAGEDN
jgi:hypothetical protein